MSDFRLSEEEQIQARMREVMFRRVSGYEFWKRVKNCELPKKYQDGRLLFIMALDLIWIIILWIGIIAKVVEDSGADFLKHYTNWGWVFNAFYYTLDLIFLLMATRWLEFTLLYIFFWQLTFQIWMIFVLVFPMLLSNPGTITDNFKQNGGQFDPGVVFVGDRIFHVVPVVVWFLYFYWRQADFIAIYHRMYYNYWANRHRDIYDWRNYGLFYYIVAMAFFQTGVFWVYYNAFDFKIVYEVSTPVWIGLLILIGLVILISLSIIWLSPIYQHTIRDLNTWSFLPEEYAEIDYLEWRKDYLE